MLIIPNVEVSWTILYILDPYGDPDHQPDGKDKKKPFYGAHLEKKAGIGFLEFSILMIYHKPSVGQIH